MTTTLPVPALAEHRFPRPVRFMLWGAIAGFIAAILITFVMALVDGQVQGLSAGSCVVYGCVLTLPLSQMVGISGMIVGAGAGALTGGAVYLVHDRIRTN